MAGMPSCRSALLASAQKLPTNQNEMRVEESRKANLEVCLLNSHLNNEKYKEREREQARAYCAEHGHLFGDPKISTANSVRTAWTGSPITNR